MVHRSVIATLKIGHPKASKAAHEFLMDSEEAQGVIAAFGKYLSSMAMAVDKESFRQEFREIQREVSREAHKDDKEDEPQHSLERPIYGVSVIRYTLQLVKAALATVVGNHFDATLDAMIASVFVETVKNTEAYVAPTSELAQVLNQFGMLSFADEDEPYRLIQGKHYMIGDGWIDIRPQICFTYYCQWIRSIGAKPLFDTEPAFLLALFRYRGVRSRKPLDTQLPGGNQLTTLRLDQGYLLKDNVQPFKDVG